MKFNKHVIVHSEDCKTNSFRKKCQKCRNEWHCDYRKREPKAPSEPNTDKIAQKVLPIVHSEACASASRRKKCKSCQNKVRREQYQSNKKKKEEAKIILRSDAKKKNKYAEFLCPECRSKKFKKTDLCEMCLRAYNKHTQRVSRERKAEKENQENQMTTDLKDFSKAERNFECELQTDGNIKSLCKVKNKKKSKVKENFDIKNILQVKRVKTLKAKNENTVKSKKYKADKNGENLSPKTIRNKTSLVRKILNTKEKKEKVIVSMLYDLDEEGKGKILHKLDSSLKEKVAKQTAEKVKESGIFGPKSDPCYKFTTALASTFQPKNPTQAMKTYSLSRKKAKQLYRGEPLQRNPYKRKLSPERIEEVERFFLSPEISRVDPCYKNVIKDEPRRYLNFPVRVAHRLYLEAFESENFTISYSKFYLLKPDNVKFVADAPLASCLCVYCQNVCLKLMKLKIPGLNSVYDLFVFSDMCKVT